MTRALVLHKADRAFFELTRRDRTRCVKAAHRGARQSFSLSGSTKVVTEGAAR